MSNEDFLKTNLNKYESLHFFSIQNGILTFNNGQMIYSLPISHLNLESLDKFYPGIFLLNPNDIFNLLYMFELFYKPVLSENDYQAINQYVENYLKIHELYTDGNQNYEFITAKLSIPIDLSYSDNLVNLPVSTTIHNAINSYNENIESGKSNGLKLVRNLPGVSGNEINDNFIITNKPNPIDEYINYAKTGFIAFLLIVGTVIATCLYIIFAIYK